MKKTAICLLLASCAWFSVGAAAANSISKYAEPQQSSRSIVYSGRIVDARNNTPLIGATIILKGTTIGASSDTEGNFRIEIPASIRDVELEVSYIGYRPETVRTVKTAGIVIRLTENATSVEEVQVIAYGQQKKVTVTGAIASIGTKDLLKSPSGSSANALAGAVTGISSVQISGQPGAEDPSIYVRGTGSLSNSASKPLILVDGVERSFFQMDPHEIESVTVLKDASSTAVFGVRGANGVILVTTRRGDKGSPEISWNSSFGLTQSLRNLTGVDSYNYARIYSDIEMSDNPSLTADKLNFSPYVIERFRKGDDPIMFPSVDWNKYIFKNLAWQTQHSATISGGGDRIRYFVSGGFLEQDGMLKKMYESYDPNYNYKRFNYRSNIDIDLTGTTLLKLNVGGRTGTRREPVTDALWQKIMWATPFSSPGFVDGKYIANSHSNYIPLAELSSGLDYYYNWGYRKVRSNELNLDLALEQQLGFITKGLKFKANFSMDYTFVENKRGVNDMYHNSQRMWVRPDTGEIILEQPELGTGLDAIINPIYWEHQAGSVNTGATYRKLYYSMQMDYARNFGKHEVTALALFSRLKEASGSVFPIYREDWVFRLTYNYAMRYFFETNGAYNGSEKFGPDYRFAFFPSFSLGWMISEEKIVKNNLKFLDMLKLRASWGRVGDDAVVQPWQRFTDGRFLYKNQLDYGGNTLMGNIKPANTPYTYYTISRLGNPNISWETVEKRNLGIDYAFLGGAVAGSVDIFNDTRTDILVKGSDRAIASYFGTDAPYANLGKVSSHGYELELRLNHTFNNGIRAWLNTSMTHAVNKVKFRDDAPLKPDYQKGAGHAINQVYSYIDHGNLATWDDVIGSPVWTTGNDAKLPGDYNIVDFNGDGVIDADDRAPYQYSTMPQNTYNASIGAEWKGFSIFAQFYGVNNVTREVNFPTFRSTAHVAYAEGDYWTPDGSATLPAPRWGTTIDQAASGTRYWYDGSYLRLKNVELSYTFQKSNWLKKIYNTQRHE